MSSKVRQAEFHVSALKEIKKFPTRTRMEVGEFIMTLEMGLDVTDFDTKPMKTIAQGAFEFRTYDAQKNYRVFYYVKLKDAIIIFHAFVKKSRKTSKEDLETGKTRLKQLLKERK